ICYAYLLFFFFQAEDGIRDFHVTGVQTCALPIWLAVHPKNEGERTGWQSTADQQQGALNKGASDIIIPGNPSFVCEIKRKDHTQSKITKDQITYLEAAQSIGSFACIALGSDAVIAAIEDWLRIYYNK